MNEILKKLYKPFAIFLLLVLVTYPNVKSILRPGYFPMHDDIQAMRVLEMDKCIKDSQIPCRWVPDMGYGYGYPQFNYYGPLPYYLMEVFHLSGFGYLDSVKAGLVFITFIGVVGMYLLGKSLWGKGGGIVSAILYAYAPYRALDFYVRGDIAELSALAIFPFLFWSVREILLGRKRSTIWFAMSVGALLATHNISTLIFTPILGLWALFIFFTNKKEILPDLKERVIALILGGIWGIFLGAFFFIPAWFEKSYAHIETLLLGYFNYLAHYATINQILFSTYWNYGSSEAGAFDELYIGIGLLHWIIPLMSLFVLFLLKKKREFKIVLFLILIGWLALFLTHEKSTFIWNHISILAYLQFPWRFLIIATFVFSLACGVLAQIFTKKVWVLVVTIFLFCIFFYSSYFRPSKWLDITDADKFSGQSWMLQQTISIFDYLPIYAKAPPGSASPEKPVFLKGTGIVTGGAIGTNHQNWDINVMTKDATVELPTYYFPVWKVFVDGKETQINYKNDLGLITFETSSGQHKIDAKLTDTPVRTLGNIATIIGLLMIPVYLFVYKKYEKNI